MIKPMTSEHKGAVLEMMRVFYASPAVLSNGSEEIFNNDIDNCINDNPYLEGYVFEENGEVCPANWHKGAETMAATHDGVAEYLSNN
jgi:hypothetical protein